MDNHSSETYLEAARNAAAFVKTRLWDGTRLSRSFRTEASHQGFADDHAWMVAGLLDLYEASWQRGIGASLVAGLLDSCCAIGLDLVRYDVCVPIHQRL